MDDPNKENIESSWVLVNSIDVAQKATVLDYDQFPSENPVKNPNNVESDTESDGISIISESSHLHESSNDEECPLNNEDAANIPEEIKNKNSLDEDDPQVRTNWMFIESKISASSVVTSNQFYLNCLQEPIQELSEHELGSVQSDLDSDSISIIGDCDFLTDHSEEEKNQEIVVKEINDDKRIENIEQPPKLPSGIKKYCNGVLATTVLLAVSSVFLGYYFNSKQIDEDVPIYNEEFTNEIPESINEFTEQYKVPTALTYCQERHKSDDIFAGHNVKKCLHKIEKRIQRKKEYVQREEELNKAKKYLKTKEKYLDDKEKNLLKREFKLLRAEYRLKSKGFKNKRSNSDNKLSDIAKQGNKETRIIVLNKDNYKQKDKNRFRPNLKYGKPLTDPVGNVYKKKKYFYKPKDCDHKESKYSYHKVDEDETIRYTYAENTPNLNYKKIKNIRRQSDNKDNCETYNSKSTNYILLGNNSNETVSGYWVGKLYKGRSDLRNKKQSSDWYFDRASYRKIKRDKAKWYFDWMMDREILRYRRSFYM